MNSSATQPPNATRIVDTDLAEQALRGHGIPSQDPNPSAQIPLRAEEAEREAHSVLAGGGVVAGAALGAIVGLMVSGPPGVAVGCTLGAVAGALCGAAAGTAMKTRAAASSSHPA